MAEHKCEPVAWMIDWPDEPELGHYFAEDPTDTGRSQPLHTAAQLAEEVERARKAERALAVAACMAFANDLRNHDVVRMTAAKCAGAVSVAAIRTADDGAQHG